MFVRIICVLLLVGGSIYSMEAQYNTNSPYGRQNSPYGRQNSIVPRADDPQEEPKPLTAEEIVENELPKIIEAAELNPFEEAVVSSILTKYLKKTIELKLLELEPQKTRETLEKIRKDQNEELKAGLPEEKYNIIMEIQEKGLRKVQADKKKKRKKKKKE